MSIKVDLKFFLFIILFFLSGQSQAYLVLYLFAAIHEMGHVAMGILLGLKLESFNIMPMGFSITFKPSKKRWITEFLVSIAGPFTNFFIAIFFSFIKFSRNNGMIIYANLILGAFNMLPMLPLDGGRAFTAILKKYYKISVAEDISHNASNIIIILLTIVAIVGTFYLKNISILCITTYLWFITLRENKRYHIKQRVKKIIEKY